MEMMRNETPIKHPMSSHRMASSQHVQPRRLSIEISPLCTQSKHILLSCGNANNVTVIAVAAAQGHGQVSNEEAPRVLRRSKTYFA
jgi:hypothetical protein